MSVKSSGRIYTCPAHPRVRESTPGRCLQCDMPLLPEGTRFALLRHMLANPLYLVVIGVALTMLTLTAALLLQ